MTDWWPAVSNTVAIVAAKLVVLPELMRGISLILLSCMPGLIGLAYWALPVYQQGQSFAAQAEELTSQLESEATSILDDPPVLGAGRPSRDDKSSRRVLQRYPVWYSDQVWLQDLVDLAKHQGVSTQELKHTGMSRKEDRSIASAMKAAWVENNMPGHLRQRGYEWRMTGSQADVSRLLANLASRALWIDALDIRPIAAGSVLRPVDKTHLNSTGKTTRTAGAQTTLVNAKLTFRQSAWIHQERKPLPANHLPAYRLDEPLGRAVEVPSLGALFSTANPACVHTTAHAAPLTESPRVFADQALEEIRLVGVIDKTRGGNDRIRRGVFRGPSGALMVAAHNAEISSSGLRLVNLSKSRGVLYSQKQGPKVMMLEPALMSRAPHHRMSVSVLPDDE